MLSDDYLNVDNGKSMVEEFSNDAYSQDKHYDEMDIEANANVDEI